MRFLIDTHALIWFMNGDNFLPYTVLGKIKNKENVCFVSIASIWEIAIKQNIGKLELLMDFNRISSFLFDNDLNVLPIEFDHLTTLLTLDLHHRDPFDRIIISQGITEDLTILTTDKQFKNYPVKCLW